MSPLLSSAARTTTRSTFANALSCWWPCNCSRRRLPYSLPPSPLSAAVAVYQSMHSCTRSAVPLCSPLSRVLPRDSIQRSSSRSLDRCKKIMNAPEGLFRGNADRFNGITVDSKEEYEPEVDFLQKLQKSLEYWKTNKRRCVWFKVQLEHAAWIPLLAKSGFDFHHANAGYLFMNNWLSTEEPANVPVYAHTMIGVGGLVVNAKQEVLVVTDRHAMIPNSWKLPGGYIEPGEDVIDGAIRELKEETGIDCEFNTVVSIRHSHGGGFGCSDIYIVVALTPKNEDCKRCEREIARVQWMPISEYLQHPDVHETNRHFMRIFQDYQKRGLRFICTHAIHRVLKKKYCLYYMQPVEEHSDLV